MNRRSTDVPSSTSGAAAISFSAITSALSRAIDLGEGMMPGHTLRTCVLGMRIADAIHLPKHQAAALHRALILKDIGFGCNEIRLSPRPRKGAAASQSGIKLQDWTHPQRPTFETIRMLWRNVLPRRSPLHRQDRAVQIPQPRTPAEIIALRCERGADIANKLGLSTETAAAIRALHERWDGSGFPEGLKGTSIPLLARILSVAQHLDVFASERDRHMAMNLLQHRSNVWFDPELVHVTSTLDTNNALWSNCLAADGTEAARQLVLDLEPAFAEGVSAADIDKICEAFADIVDAKSPFTYRHSIGVAEAAASIATVLQLAPERVQLVRRAALLHDLGKLAVPNSILDKEGDLTASEWDVIVEHPRLTREILSSIESFAELAEVAGAHHEKLDGSGYPEGLTADQLSLESRIVAVADVYQALIERRPYRDGMSHAEAMTVLHRLAGIKLDAHCIAAIAVARDPWTVWTPTTRIPTSGQRRHARAESVHVKETAMSA